MPSGYTSGYTSSQTVPPRQGAAPVPGYTAGYGSAIPAPPAYTSSQSGIRYWDPVTQSPVMLGQAPPGQAGGVLGLRPTNPTVPVPGGPRTPTAAEVAAKAAADAAAAQRAAQAKADAEAAEAKRKAGQSFLDRASNLEGQIEALRYALSDKGFEAALNQNLADILKTHEAGIALLKEGHAERAKGFLGQAEDTEKAAAAQAGGAFENLVRERQDTMTGLLAQGAGETDMLKAMVMAARQFGDNQAEGNRAYFDTMRSIGTGLADLNLDTRTSMQNAAQGLESERDRLWQDFYNRRSETYTQLGNTLGQQSDYYISAEENDVTSGGKRQSTKTAADEAFMNAAKETGKSYTQQGVPQWLQEWKGVEAPKAKQANTDLAAAVQFEPLGAAEGATLRGW